MLCSSALEPPNLTYECESNGGVPAARNMLRPRVTNRDYHSHEIAIVLIAVLSSCEARLVVCHFVMPLRTRVSMRSIGLSV